MMLLDNEKLHWTENLEIWLITLLPALFSAYGGTAVALFCLLGINIIIKNFALKRWSFFGWHQDKNYKYDKFPLVFIFMIAYWTVYLVSLIWTENLSYGVREISSQTWMLLFPLIFAITDFREIGKHHIRSSLLWMVSFLTVTFIFRFVEFVYQYSCSQSDSFIWYMLSRSIEFYPTHHSYMSLYILTGLGFLYSEFQQIKKAHSPTLLAIMLSACACCLCMFLLCINSRAGLLCLLVLLLMCWIHIVFFKRNYKLGIISFIVGALLVAGIHFALPAHFRNLSSTVIELVSGNSDDCRLEIMKNACLVIKENPVLGVGAGDRMDVLSPFYENSVYGITYNPHNQYLDTMMTIGIPGIILLLMMIFIPLLKAFKERKFGFFTFFVIFAVSILFESMLERQMGIFFFCLMTFLFTLDSKKKSVSLQFNSIK